MLFPNTTYSWTGDLEMMAAANNLHAQVVVKTDPQAYLNTDDSNLPIGKGIWIWNYPKVGTPEQVRDGCVQMGLNHAILCIARGRLAFPDPVWGWDYDVGTLVSLLKAAGIQVWGYHAPVGDAPVTEADKAVDRMIEFALYGLIVNAEKAFRWTPTDDVARNRATSAARAYMQRLRQRAPSMPIGLSSNRYPLTSWTNFPWLAFREYCDFDVAQVYWLYEHNPVYQLNRSYNEFKGLAPVLPYLATGPAWKQEGWQPTAKDILEFMDTAKDLGLAAVNFWEYSRVKELPEVWSAIAAYDLGAPLPWPEPIPDPIPGDEDMDLSKIRDSLVTVYDCLSDMANAVNEILVELEGGTVPPDPDPEPEPTPVGTPFRITEDPRCNARCFEFLNKDGVLVEDRDGAGKPIFQIYPKDSSDASERAQFTKDTIVQIKLPTMTGTGGVKMFELVSGMGRYGRVWTKGVDGQRLFVPKDNGTQEL